MSSHLAGRFILAAVVVVAGIGLGCGDDNPVSPTPQSTTLKVSFVAPSTGPSGAATDIKVIGTAFKPGATLTLGGVAVPAVVTGNTLITATAPAHASGSVDVVVTNPDGESSRLAAGFSYVTPLTSLVITGNTSFTSAGETSQLTATAGYADGLTRDVTKDARWSSSLSTVATVSTAGILTARSLGSANISAQYPPNVSPALFRSVRATVTPAGTFTVSGRARQPGAGGLGDVRVLHTLTGQFSLTSSDGAYSIGGLTDGRLSFTKPGFEDAQLVATPDGNDDVPMQPIIHIAAGDNPLTTTLAPNDMDYLVDADTHCQPCRLFRVRNSTPGTVQVRVTSGVASQVLNIWVNGRAFLGVAGASSVVADVPVGDGDTLLYVGKIRPPTPGDYLNFVVSVIPPGQSR